MDTTLCYTFWGSHGCFLEYGHEGLHFCDCCDLEDSEHIAEHLNCSEDSYGSDGCAGYWPYYGREAMEGSLMFFRYPDDRFVQMPAEFDRMAGVRESLRG